MVLKYSQSRLSAPNPRVGQAKEGVKTPKNKLRMSDENISNIKALEQKLQELRNSIRVARDQKTEIATTIQAIDGEMQELRAQLAGLQDQKAGYAERQQMLDDKIASYNEQIEQVNTSIKKSRQNIYKKHPDAVENTPQHQPEQTPSQGQLNSGSGITEKQRRQQEGHLANVVFPNEQPLAVDVFERFGLSRQG